MKSIFSFGVFILVLNLFCAYKVNAQNCNTDYKNLTGGNIRALEQKIETCGCPTSIYKIEEYAVYSRTANSVNKAGGNVTSDTKSVILRRSGWAYDFKNCSRARFWSDTNADGVVYKESSESVDSWVGKTINGKIVTKGFGVEY
jgi:hypothetical protein